METVSILSDTPQDGDGHDGTSSEGAVRNSFADDFARLVPLLQDMQSDELEALKADLYFAAGTASDYSVVDVLTDVAEAVLEDDSLALSLVYWIAYPEMSAGLAEVTPSVRSWVSSLTPGLGTRIRRAWQVTRGGSRDWHQVLVVANLGADAIADKPRLTFATTIERRDGARLELDLSTLSLLRLTRAILIEMSNILDAHDAFNPYLENDSDDLLENIVTRARRVAPPPKSDGTDAELVDVALPDHPSGGAPAVHASSHDEDSSFDDG